MMRKEYLINGDRDMKKNRTGLLSLILAAIMVLSSFAPALAAEQKISTPSAAVQTSAYHRVTAKRFYLGGYDVTFNSAVVSDTTLDAGFYTDTLKASAKKKKIKLSWTPPLRSAEIDGYIILRKDRKSDRWREIARVGKNLVSYTDKKAKKKNVYYQYILVTYKSVGGQIQVSAPGASVGALTTKSKKKNVTSVKFTNLASLKAIMRGRSAVASFKYPKKAYDRTITMVSSDSNIAEVLPGGIIVGKNPGKAVITARTHTGATDYLIVTVFIGGTAQSMIDVMESWMDFSYYNGYHKGIVDIYNSFYPLPVGYKMSYLDAWCDCTVSAAAIQSGNVDRVGRECGVGRHVKIFKEMGIWIEGNNTVPQPGDLIVFNWIPTLKNNCSHIGIVQKVEGTTITTIEGNMGVGKVGTRTIQVGWKFIKGYARPNYLTEAMALGTIAN